MLFSSSLFLLLFLPAIVTGNFLVKTQYSNYLLLAASLIFYAWGEPVYVLIMLFSIVINWVFGILVDRSDKYKVFFLTVCIIINLSILGYYKYYNFFVQIINSFFNFHLFNSKEISLPIGISFFTFQSLSYVIDLYRKECRVQKNILNLALYVSFFPQLIAGPIVRFCDVDKQIESREVSVDKFAVGFRRFMYGLGKKIIISNTMAEVVDIIYAKPFDELTTIAAWFGAIAYMMQIYYDFSGYSDMAIGLGKIFGFDFLENFNYPYVSRSIQEFWQRWHISLGTWFREYVYIPLGGNRKGKVRTYINLTTVFFLTGMWHGASWNFIVWGLYHGFFQIVERFGLKKYLQKHKLISHCYCLIVALFGWVLFRANSLSDAIRYILRMVAPWRYGLSEMFSVPAELTMHNVIIMIIALCGSGLLQVVVKKKVPVAAKWKNSYLELAYLMLMVLYCCALLAAGTYNPFIYFRF